MNKPFIHKYCRMLPYRKKNAATRKPDRRIFHTHKIMLSEHLRIYPTYPQAVAPYSSSLTCSNHVTLDPSSIS